MGCRNRAEMGIGTLIIFIAMILVAAIAAGVLLQTASSLQNKALLTGEKAKGQVSTDITPMILYGEDGTTQVITQLFLKTTLAPGSDPVKLDELLLSIDMTNSTADLTYRNGTCELGNATSGFYTNSTGGGYYTVSYLLTADSHMDGYLQRGDIAEFCFAPPRAVQEGESIDIRLTPKVGTPTSITTAMPDVMTSKRVVIYP